MKTLEILSEQDKEQLDIPRISIEEGSTNTKKLYIESYGCQMNFSDSEIVTSILKKESNFSTTASINDADLILLNTCAIRENAEIKVRNRLRQLAVIKKQNPDLIIGVLGCMAERLKTKFLEEEKIVDIVAGPDAYRDFPKLFLEAETGQKAVNVFLSREETYADIAPVRLNSNGVTAFVSIMRGCDNMCSFCVVPYTRGRERSRSMDSILKECSDLIAQGYKEVTLLGQNVDSYKYQLPNDEVISFAKLLENVALLDPTLRVRFSTSHPKDINDDVLFTIKKYENICNYIHLPVQSGSSKILDLMNRNYTREWYLNRISRIREILGPDCGVSQDMIIGFCNETEEDHLETLSLLEAVKFDYGYMFTYSERPGTPAAKKYVDNVPEETKKRRLQEVINLQRQHSLERNLSAMGKIQKVLIEGFSKKSENDFQGRSDQNKVVVFPKENFKIGDYVNVLITECSSGTLIGKVVESTC